MYMFIYILPFFKKLFFPIEGKFGKDREEFISFIPCSGSVTSMIL